MHSSSTSTSWSTISTSRNSKHWTSEHYEDLPLRLSARSEVRRPADEALERLPRIDVLVNNVGGY